MNLEIDFMINTFLHTLTGIPNTLKMTFFSLLLASPVAFFMAVAKIKEIRWIHPFINLYLSFIRGTPMVLQILIIYSLIPSLLNRIIKSVNIDINIFGVPPIIYAYIVFTLNSIAILCECFRSALLTVPKGQLEAAKAVGLTSSQGYIRIIIPQALVVALPNICNATVNLLKGTSLAFLMTVKDITAIAKMDAAFGYNYIEAYIVIFFVYIILCSIVQLLYQGLERFLAAYKNSHSMEEHYVRN